MLLPQNCGLLYFLAEAGWTFLVSAGLLLFCKAACGVLLLLVVLPGRCCRVLECSCRLLGVLKVACRIIGLRDIFVFVLLFRFLLQFLLRFFPLINFNNKSVRVALLLIHCVLTVRLLDFRFNVAQVSWPLLCFFFLHSSKILRVLCLDVVPLGFWFHSCWRLKLSARSLSHSGGRRVLNHYATLVVGREVFLMLALATAVLLMFAWNFDIDNWADLVLLVWSFKKSSSVLLWALHFSI
jgi:hypothetical protein